MTNSIQAHPVDPTPPAAGEALVSDGLKYVPTVVSTGGGGVGNLTRVTLAAPILGLSTPFGASIPFDTEVIDENNAWAIGSPNKFTISTTGTYRVQVSVQAQIDAGTQINFNTQLEVLGTPEVGSDYLSNNPDAAYKWLTATMTRVYTAGEEIVFGYTFASQVTPSVRIFAGAFATLERLK